MLVSSCESKVPHRCMNEKPRSQACTLAAREAEKVSDIFHSIRGKTCACHQDFLSEEFSKYRKAIQVAQITTNFHYSNFITLFKKTKATIFLMDGRFFDIKLSFESQINRWLLYNINYLSTK